jgi:hypothetical protein
LHCKVILSFGIFWILRGVGHGVCSKQAAPSFPSFADRFTPWGCPKRKAPALSGDCAPFYRSHSPHIIEKRSHREIVIVALRSWRRCYSTSLPFLTDLAFLINLTPTPRQQQQQQQQSASQALRSALRSNVNISVQYITVVYCNAKSQVMSTNKVSNSSVLHNPALFVANPRDAHASQRYAERWRLW